MAQVNSASSQPMEFLQSDGTTVTITPSFETQDQLRALEESHPIAMHLVCNGVSQTVYGADADSLRAYYQSVKYGRSCGASTQDADYPALDFKDPKQGPCMDGTYVVSNKDGSPQACIDSVLMTRSTYALLSNSPEQVYSLESFGCDHGHGIIQEIDPLNTLGVDIRNVGNCGGSVLTTIPREASSMIPTDPGSQDPAMVPHDDAYRLCKMMGGETPEKSLLQGAIDSGVISAPTVPVWVSWNQLLQQSSDTVLLGGVICVYNIPADLGDVPQGTE